jgi:hypothetical protein
MLILCTSPNLALLRKAMAQKRAVLIIVIVIIIIIIIIIIITRSFSLKEVTQNPWNVWLIFKLMWYSNRDYFVLFTYISQEILFTDYLDWLEVADVWEQVVFTVWSTYYSVMFASFPTLFLHPCLMRPILSLLYACIVMNLRSVFVWSQLFSCVFGWLNLSYAKYMPAHLDS